MPPKKSDVHHITFHFARSAILLSVPSSTTLSALKTQLIPAFKPLSAALPSLPTSPKDFRLWDERPEVEGEGAMRDLEAEEGGAGRSIAVLGWGRWKRVFVSFRGDDGEFAEPEYTIPDVDDEAPEET